MEDLALVLAEMEWVSLTAELYLNINLDDNYFNDNVIDNEMMKLIDNQLLDDVSRLAQKSERLRMNYNFHQSLEDKCHL